MKYNILSLDGGGIRGVFASRIIHRLEEACPGFLSKIQLVAGTSTGGLISLSIASGMSADEIVYIYLTHGERIFSQSLFRRLCFNLFLAKFDNAGLRVVTKAIFGDIKLSELKKKVLIASFDLDSSKDGHRSYRPKFFTNLTSQDSDLLVRDIAVCTTSAPTYFASYKGFVDGGIICNSPSVAALAQSLNPNIPPVPDLSEINLLSIGCGKNDNYISGRKHDWGIFNWGYWFIDVCINSDHFVADYQCRQFLKDRYFRTNPLLKQDYPMDDPKMGKELVQEADEVNIDDAVKWINNNIQQ